MSLIAGLAAAMAIPSMVVENAADARKVSDLDYFPKNKRGKGQNNRRGKGKRNPPKSRPNRLHMSKRIRRKHRRAA